MRTKVRRFNKAWLPVLAASIFLWPLVAYAQDQPSAAEEVDNIKLRLIELSSTEESLKLQVQQLDEALKPENIERSLAGYGSTKPEELREQRRRQLSIEKTAVVGQLEILTNQRSRLETALATAEAHAYQQSARGFPEIQNQLIGSPGSVRWLVTVSLLGMLLIALVGAALFKFRYATRIRRS